VAVVKPRDAASLLLYRQGADRHEVLVGLRPSQSRFMPDVFVFPGGAVDPSDARAKPSSKLCESFSPYMAIANSHTRAQTIAMAAVRETLEETGIAIVKAGHPGAVKDPTWQALAKRGVSADLSVLKYFARATTPADQPIRFHARFFVCAAEDVVGLNTDQLEQTDELLDLQWMPIDNPNKLPLRTVTQFLLQELSDWLDPTQKPKGYPAFTQRRSKPVVVRSGYSV